MTIFDYLQTDHPWFDTSRYTPGQIALFATGAVLWIVAYVVTIRGLRRRQVLDIPIVAVVLNYGCEISTAVFFVPDMGDALVLAYWAWMVLDTWIVYGLFRHGAKQVTKPYFQRHFRPYLWLCLPLSFAVQCTFITQYDLPMAPLDSYIINAVMSFAFINLLFVPGVPPPSRALGWAKGLGTGLISVMFFSKYPDNYFLISLYVTCAVFDGIYLLLLYNRTAKDVVHGHTTTALV